LNRFIYRVINRESIETMRWYYWLILVVLIWYVLYYYTSPRKIAILQTSLPEFTFDILLHRQPIVLSEQISDIQTLKDAWFSSNKVDIYQQSVRETDDWKKNKYKYLLLQPVEATEVILYPANKSMTAEKVPPENEKLLAIKCKPNQVIILPFRWHFYIPKEQSYIWMGVHDWITRFLP